MHGNVTADFYYTTFETDAGDLLHVPATFAGGVSNIDYDTFFMSVMNSIDHTCVASDKSRAPPLL